jgi:hypothetical protein
MEWKWTKGETYEKSKRQIQPKDEVAKEEVATEKFNKELETLAYSSSLNYDEDTWDILNQSIAKNDFKMSNKREDLNFKMADRELIQQTIMNPFLNQMNYADDVTLMDKKISEIPRTNNEN